MQFPVDLTHFSYADLFSAGTLGLIYKISRDWKKFYDSWRDLKREHNMMWADFAVKHNLSPHKANGRSDLHG